ncbi:MAG: diguanylate cyclase [Acidobacteriota bacterium]
MSVTASVPASDAPSDVEGRELPGVDRIPAAFLRSLVTAVQAGVLIEDEDRRLLTVNRAFCDLFHHPGPPAELVGRSFRQVLSGARSLPGDRNAALAGLEALADERRRILSEELRLEDGRTLEMDSFPVADGEGRGGHAWIFRDITEHRRTQEELRQTAERYRDFVENGLALAWSHDLDGTLRGTNRAFAQIFGAESPEALTGRRIQDSIDPRFRGDWERYVDELRSEGHARGLVTIVRPDGGRRVLAFSNVLRTDDAGSPVVRGFGENVTERILAEQALHRRSQLETRLVSISTRLISAPVEQTGAAIEEALAELGRTLELDGCQIFLFDDESKALLPAHGWMSEGIDRREVLPPQIRGPEIPGIKASLDRLEPYRLERLEDLPADQEAQARFLGAYGIRSLLAVPVAVRGKPLGFVGLASMRQERRWPDEVVSVVRVIGDILGGAIDRKRTEESLAAANRSLETFNRTLRETKQKMELLNEMGEFLLSARTTDEAQHVIRSFLPRAFAGSSGVAYLKAEEASPTLDPVVAWGSQEREVAPLSLDDCWALRRSRAHRSCPQGGEPACPHLGKLDEAEGLCIPLMAQGRAVGLLHLRTGAGGDPAAPGPDTLYQLAHSTAEQLALGLANLQLRRTLEAQALHDPLTGLHNRRHLEQHLEQELRRAARSGRPLAVLMLDLDRFKRINDLYGHAAGDRVLVHFGRFLGGSVRAEELAARYGGEEFTVILPETSADEAHRAAEKLRLEVRRLPVELGQGGSERLTVSVGVAVYPDCATDAGELLAAADGALYRAKREGRDRVVAASAGVLDPAPRLLPAGSAG